MKILHTFDFFSPSGGGTVDVLYKLSRAQARQGDDVTIYTSDFKLDKKYIASLPEVKIVTFHCISGAGAFYFMPAMNGTVRDNLKNFDIVHLHCFRSYQNIVLHHYTTKYGIPYIMDSHGSLPRVAAGESGLKWTLRWFFDAAIGNRILEDAARIVTENKFGLKEYENFRAKNKKTAVIPLFYPVNDFNDLPPRGEFRARYNLGNKKIVMSLGRINRIKGLDFMVSSFAELARSRDDVMLVIVGNDDGYKSEIVKMVEHLGIERRVLFTGFLGGREKLAALVDADILVQPSMYEQAAWAPIEAVLCGTPVIVSENSGSGEDISRIQAGYLVNYGDRKQLVRTIERVLENPAESKEMVRRAQQYIRTNLSLDKKVEEYKDLYRQCIEEVGTLRRDK